jgi:hypothetical protein
MESDDRPFMIQRAASTRTDSPVHRLLLLPMRSLFLAAAITTACGRGEPKEPDLPKQLDRWVSSIVLDADSKVEYVGKTKNYVVTSVTSVKDMSGLRTVSVGDNIEALRIGAIKCSFFWRDASYGGKQFMWRGRWGCQAGRNREEVQRAVRNDGEKVFDYLHVSPVRLEE